MKLANNLILMVALAITGVVCTSCKGGSSFLPNSMFSKSEKAIIYSGLEAPAAASEKVGQDASLSEPLLHVYSIEVEEELEVLRAKSTHLSRSATKSNDFKTLARRMVTTVSDPSVGGVGIAAPQVGINRRIVVVKRFDKEGEPFEVYPNIHITKYSKGTQTGPEGCLSVPNRREQIVRSEEVEISYSDPATFKTVKETVTGFTAVIFQHEVDHLEGIIYTDHLQ